MPNDEETLELRDKLAIEIFNGILSYSKRDLAISPDIMILSYDNTIVSDKTRDEAYYRIECVVRSCYKVADIMRKVRLSAFE